MPQTSRKMKACYIMKIPQTSRYTTTQKGHWNIRQITLRDVWHTVKFLKKSLVVEVDSSTYPGLVLNLSKFSKINKMQVCLNDIAWKASESSYMLETFSSDISLNENRKKYQMSSFNFKAAKGFKDLQTTLLAYLCNGILAESLKSLQKILVSCSKQILSNIQCNIYWSGVYKSVQEWNQVNYWCSKRKGLWGRDWQRICNTSSSTQKPPI